MAKKGATVATMDRAQKRRVTMRTIERAFVPGTLPGGRSIPSPWQQFLDQPWPMGRRVELAMLDQKWQPAARVFQKNVERLRDQVRGEMSEQLDPPENLKQIRRDVQDLLDKMQPKAQEAKSPAKPADPAGFVDDAAAVLQAAMDAAPELVAVLLESVKGLIDGQPIIPPHKIDEAQERLNALLEELRQSSVPMTFDLLPADLLEELPDPAEYREGDRPITGSALAQLSVLFTGEDPNLLADDLELEGE